MNSKIKVIKGGTRTNPSTVAGAIQKTERERERETADTVKNWIAEWHERKRALSASASALISSVDQVSQIRA